MAQSYTRQSTFADGDTITASLFNNEYNQLLNAFAYSSSSASTTGHRHDGSTGQGGNVPQIGDLDFNNKIVVDSTNNRWGVYVEVSGSAVEQVRIQDGAIVPVTDNDIDLGTSSLEFKDLFLDGTAHVDTLDVDVNATVAGTLGVTGVTTLSSNATVGGTLGVTGAITGSSTLQATTITATTAFVPDASDGASLGTVSLEFSDLFLADGALIAFGDDQDVTLTHLADAGLLLNGARGLFFNDTTQYINAPNSTTLDIAATDEIELTATLIDINGAVDISGNLDIGGNLVVTGTTTFNGGTLTMGDAATDNVVFGADINSNIIPNTDNTYDLGSSSQEWKDIYINGTAYLDAIDFNGTVITATAAELNIMDGVTSTAAELNILDGVTSTAAELNILDGVTATTAELNIMDGVTATTAELNILDGVTSTAAELNILDGVTATASELNIMDGVTATTDELNIMDGVTSTAAELNILDGVTSTAVELNILDGVTSTTAELNILDGVTASAADINLIDGITNGTVIASKAIITDANKDISGGRNITISGELDAASLDISGDADIDGTLEADAITVNGTALDEVIADTVGAMVSSNTETNIAVTYDDSDNTLDFVIGTLNQDTTGNAATATALETARTIGGVSFDGTANITPTTFTTATFSGDVNVDSGVLFVDVSENKVGINQSSPDVSLDLGSNTDAVHVPVGTTAQRPGSAAAGYFRYNTSLSQFEGYTDAWGAIGGGGTNTFTHDVFTCNGSTTAFALSQSTESENNLIVFVDGVFQEQSAYSIATSSGVTTLTMSAAPANGRKLVVYTVAAGVSGSNLNIDTMTGDGSDTTLTLSINPVNENNTQVFIDGVYQSKANYSISGTTLTFSTAPPTGSSVEVMTMTQTDINVPVDGTITSAKLSGDLVTPGALDVTGTVTADGLTVDGSAVVRSGNTLTLNRTDNATGGAISYVAGTGFIFNDANGDGTSFNVGAATKVRISDGKLLLGTTSSGTTDLLQIESPATGGGYGIQIRRNDNNSDQQVGQIKFGNTVDSDLGMIAVKTDGANNNGAILFSTALSQTTSERMRITSAGALQLSDVNSPNDINTAIYSNSDVLEFEAFGTNGAIAFSTGSGVTERMKIDSDGVAHFNGDVKVLSGDIQMGSGRGINFSATANSSGTMSSETLDDYEEGTWTPTAYVGSTQQTISVNRANYTKIGDLVTVNFHFSASGQAFTNSGSAVEIRGLPFASSGTAHEDTGTLITNNVNWDTAHTYLVLYKYSGEANDAMNIFKSGDALPWDPLGGSEVAQNNEFIGQIAYRTS